MEFSFYLTNFLGESVDDCGGGYSESVAEMCDELQNGSLPLLVLTPNGRDDAGTNKDCFLLNPAAKSSLHMEMFRFLGNMLLPSLIIVSLIICLWIKNLKNIFLHLIIKIFLFITISYLMFIYFYIL